MTDITAQALRQAKAGPLSVTVSEDGQHWHVRVWVDTYPDTPGVSCELVYEVTLSCVHVPLVTTHVNLWRNVALVLEDFADGAGLPDNGA